MPVVGAAIVVIIICAVVIYLRTQYAPAGYKISGYVKTDGTALPGATVTVGGKSATTDSNGYYEITGLEGNKSYTLTVSKLGYESYSATIQLGTQDKQLDEIILKILEVEMPLTAIRNALAIREGVPVDNVELYFCVKAAETDNFAIGAIINNRKSIVFFYIESTNTITAENEYTATTSDEQAVMDKFVVKKPISKFTGHKIVPFTFVKRGTAYSFNYYDGYDMYLRRWGFGTANMDAAGNIPPENMTHSWI